MIKNLVINGCSYAESYALGNGHVDLAKQLDLNTQSTSLAIGGSSNSRILRTTLKHSYQTAEPTLYVLGLTFVSRAEIPICTPDNDFEGRWINPQNQEFKHRWQLDWSQNDSDRFVEIKLKSEVYSIIDRTEDLMYRMLATIADLHSRGHKVLMFQQADNLYQEYLDHPRLQLFRRPEILDGFRWCAIAWQAQQGVAPTRGQVDLTHQSHHDKGN